MYKYTLKVHCFLKKTCRLRSVFEDSVEFEWRRQLREKKKL